VRSRLHDIIVDKENDHAFPATKFSPKWKLSSGFPISPVRGRSAERSFLAGRWRYHDGVRA
jgi:hypothetical protein